LLLDAYPLSVVASLPPHHRDLIDRLLVAQAQIEEVAVLTADREFERYDVRVKRA
jgi:PIN domain nuclease of toxin-antitoxin system